MARNPKNIEWLKESFAEAKEQRYAGILIAIQADMYFPFELSDGIYQDEFLPAIQDENNGYRDFFNTLLEETQSFDGKVLLVHGGSHYFKIDKPMYNDPVPGTGQELGAEISQLVMESVSNEARSVATPEEVPPSEVKK